MTQFKGCDKCNRSSLSLLLLRPSPVPLDPQVGLGMFGLDKVESDLPLMEGLLPDAKITQSRFALRLLRPGYLHVYYKKPVATAPDWQVFRITSGADLIPEGDPLFAQKDVDFKCSDKQHNPSGLKLLNIPQAHKVKKIWIAFSANQWSKEIRAKNKENPAVMQSIEIAGGSKNTFKPSAENLRLKVLECGIDQWTVGTHDFPFYSFNPKNKMNPGEAPHLVDHLAAEMIRAAAAHPATKGKEVAVVLRDPVGIAAELNFLRLARSKLIETELAKPAVAHPYNSSAALLGMKDKFIEIASLKAFDAISPVRERSSLTARELATGAEWKPLTAADKEALLAAIPATAPFNIRFTMTERIKGSGRLVHQDQDRRTRKWIEEEKEKMWAKLEPHFDETKRAAWMAAHEKRMKTLHYDPVELFEKDWSAAVGDSKTKAYFAAHFDTKDPNDNKLFCSGAAFAAESHNIHAPGPESKGQVLTDYLKLLSEDVRKDTTVFLRSLVYNQESLFSYLHNQLTGDPGDTGMRDKIFDILKEIPPGNKYFSWLGEGYAFFGVGQMTAVSAASLAAATSFLKNTAKGRDILARVKQLWGISNSIEFLRKASLETSLKRQAPVKPVLIYKLVDRLTAFAAMNQNPHALPGMSKTEVYHHTKNNQLIPMAILTTTYDVHAVGGSIDNLARAGNATDIKIGAAATGAFSAAAVKVTPEQAVELIGRQSNLGTLAVGEVRTALAASQRAGASAVFMTIDGRLALASMVVQGIGIYHTFLTIMNSEDAGKVRDAKLGMADSVAGLMSGFMLMIDIAVVARHNARAASVAIANDAIAKSRLLAGLRVGQALCGVAGGVINAYAMFMQ